MFSKYKALGRSQRCLSHGLEASRAEADAESAENHMMVCIDVSGSGCYRCNKTGYISRDCLLISSMICFHFN